MRDFWDYIIFFSGNKLVLLVDWMYCELQHLVNNVNREINGTTFISRFFFKNVFWFHECLFFWKRPQQAQQAQQPQQQQQQQPQQPQNIPNMNQVFAQLMAANARLQFPVPAPIPAAPASTSTGKWFVFTI